MMTACNKREKIGAPGSRHANLALSRNVPAYSRERKRIVDGDDCGVRVGKRRARYKATNTAEAIDSNLGRHDLVSSVY